MNADPFQLVRAFNRMHRADFTLKSDDNDLMISPFSSLTDQQRAFLRTHKAALVALLTDAETLAALLEHAGSAGLGWREGTPRYKTLVTSYRLG